jgi:hypothetical protein
MNLSCGNCKAIRSFSGQPPACNECGWVCTSETTQNATEPKRTTYSKSPAQTAHEDRIRGYKIIGVAFGILIVVGTAMGIWESKQDRQTVKEFLSSHSDCHYPADTLLEYLSKYNKQVDWANLATACVDLAHGTHSFQLASPSPQQPPESTETYAPISIVSSAIEHSAMLQDYCVATFKWENIRYTVERRKGIWPFDCEVLQNDKMYFARWTSDKHDEFSIGPLKPEILARRQWPESVKERDLENVLTYNVRHWSE